ncbi:hypothetical protein O3M35_008163 [Rhynocoris fuscipes]|uniref:Uncharacterized protein n=1 Tax=Rhynocoris fuscipes TaxID=488301 RepID=A0AAW1D6L2_9HEMI
MYDSPANSVIEELLSKCKTKKLKDVIIDIDDYEKYEKYLRLTDDNINDIDEQKPTYSFTDYIAANQDPLYELAVADDSECDEEFKKRIVKNSEEIWYNRNKLKLMKKCEKLNRLKAEIRKKKNEEKYNSIFYKPKWWMNDAEYIVKKCKKKKRLSEEKPQDKDKEGGDVKMDTYLQKEMINVYDFLKKRREINEKKRIEKALKCINFWEHVRKERKDLVKMMLGVQLKKYFLKIRRQNKLKKKTRREPLSVILINLTYLKLKRKQCARLMKKHFHSIIGATDEEVKQLKTKLNEVKQLFRKRNDWCEEHLISLMKLSKKVYNADKNKNSMKEEVINNYVDGIYTMMAVHKKTAKDIRASVIHDQILYNEMYTIMKDTEIFIAEQISIFNYLKRLLLHPEWTYLYYVRMRVISLLDKAIKNIVCSRYKLPNISTERLNEDERDQHICEEQSVA